MEKRFDIESLLNSNEMATTSNDVGCTSNVDIRNVADRGSAMGSLEMAREHSRRSSHTSTQDISQMLQTSQNQYKISTQACPDRSQTNATSENLMTVGGLDCTMRTNDLTSNVAAILPSMTVLDTYQMFNWCAKCNTSFRMTSDLVHHIRKEHR